MNSSATKEAAVSSGVDALITRLRTEGVSAGKIEANSILEVAKQEAKQILGKAQTQARDYLESSRKEAKSYQLAGEESLKAAMRDAVLDMKSNLMQHFSSDVNRLISTQLKNPDMIKQMILEITSQTSEELHLKDQNELEIILPSEVYGLDELRQNPAELGQGALIEFVRGLTGEMLREGVTLKHQDDFTAGIKVQVIDNNLILDLSDEAIAGLLLQHLQPRFRAILEGIVK